MKYEIKEPKEVARLPADDRGYRRHRVILRVVLGLFVSALFLLLLLRQVQLDELTEAFRDVGWAWIAFASIPFILGLWVRAVRWQLVLRPSIDLSLKDAFSILVIGCAANNLLPVRMGEVVRTLMVEQVTGAPRMLVLGTIFVERIFDGLVLALFLSTTLVLVESNGTLHVLAIVSTVGFVGATLLLASIVAFPERGERLLEVLLQLSPSMLQSRMRSWLSHLLNGLSQLRGRKSWVMVSSTTALSWTLEAMAYWMIGEAFGLDLAPWLYLGVTGAANLAIAAPSTSGGIGPFEYFVRETLIVFGIMTVNGTAYALALHTLILLPVVVVGLVLLWKRQLGPMVLAQPERILHMSEPADANQ